MANKKSTKKKTQKPTKSKQNHSKQIKAIVLMAVAVFILAIVFIPSGSLGSAGIWIKKIIFGVVGFCSYIFPFVLGYIAIVIATEKNKLSKTTCVFALLLAVFVDTAFETFGHPIENAGFFKYLGESFTFDSANFGGGILGGILSYPLTYFLGAPLCNITIVILIVVSLMILT
ncbi:MAG: hypothetical protein IJO19_02475 [Clostridia bacterium]|nr:hypothetical protein [Clostridia bacterium]